MGASADASENLIPLDRSSSLRPQSPKLLVYDNVLTGKECVNLIVTDLAVIQVTPQGLLLREIAPGATAEDIQKATEPQLILSGDLKTIEV